MNYHCTETGKALEQELLARIDSVAAILEADTVAAEELNRLPATSVQALRDSRLYALKSAREVGGFEADLNTQLTIFEKVAYLSPSACWNLFISCAGAALASAFLPDDTVKEMFDAAKCPTFTSGGGHIPGSLREVEGGYILDGKWIYGSGIHQADWSLVPAKVEGSDVLMNCAVPSSAFTIHKTWDVVGIKGSGSDDYSISGQFVPKSHVYTRALGRKRGGASFNLGFFSFITVELVGFMLGVAQKALDEFIATTKGKSRGYNGQMTEMKAQPVLQREIALNDQKLKAARALAHDVNRRAMQAAEAGQAPDAALEAEVRAAALYVAEISIEVVNSAFRYSGGSSIWMTSALQRCLRDIHAAGTHFVVSHSSYEAYGAQLLAKA